MAEKSQWLPLAEALEAFKDPALVEVAKVAREAAKVAGQLARQVMVAARQAAPRGSIIVTPPEVDSAQELGSIATQAESAIMKSFHNRLLSGALRARGRFDGTGAPVQDIPPLLWRELGVVEYFPPRIRGRDGKYWFGVEIAKARASDEVAPPEPKPMELTVRLDELAAWLQAREEAGENRNEQEDLRAAREAFSGRPFSRTLFRIARKKLQRRRGAPLGRRRVPSRPKK